MRGCVCVCVYVCGGGRKRKRVMARKEDWLQCINLTPGHAHFFFFAM